MPKDVRRHVIHAYSEYGNKVAPNLEKTVENRQLQDLIQEVRIPTEMITGIKNRKKREVKYRIYPSYVLVKMVLTDESQYVVRNIRGCTGFIGPTSKPIPLTDEEAAHMGVEKKTAEVSYQVGNFIHIVDGPLEGFVGTVEEVDPDKNRVHVAVSTFGRETPVRLEFDQTELVSE